MILNIIKGLWKWAKWILLILILGLLILALRIFIIDKDYNGAKMAKERKDKISSSVTDTTDGSSNSGLGSDSSSSSKSGSSSDSSSSSADNRTIGQKVVDGAKGIANATVKGYKEDEEYIYNPIDFDEWFLMFEGENNEAAIRNVLEHLLENSNGNFYARTSVTAVGFGQNNTVSYNGDLVSYQNGIQEMINNVIAGTYEISFKYAGIMTYVNEIVITRK